MRYMLGAHDSSLEVHSRAYDVHFRVKGAEAWKQQVADNLPPEKAEAAYEALQRETGLGRGELGLPPRLKEET